VSIAADVLLAAGVIVAVVSALGAVVARDLRVRLHFLTPVTSVAGPLVGAAVVVANGMGSMAVQAVLVVALLAVTGPVLSVATGRLVARRAESR
jgi:multisubunit Na+/H+ antiporter MnhG subunit